MYVCMYVRISMVMYIWSRPYECIL